MNEVKDPYLCHAILSWQGNPYFYLTTESAEFAEEACILNEVKDPYLCHTSPGGREIRIYLTTEFTEITERRAAHAKNAKKVEENSIRS